MEPILDTKAGNLLKVSEIGRKKEGVFRQDLSPRVAARVLWGALDGLALTWALGPMAEGKEIEPDPGDLRKAALQSTELFLDGLRARAGATA